MTTPTTDIFSLPHTTPQNVEMPRVGLSQGEGEGEPSSSQNQQLNWYHNADVFNGAVSSLPHYSITYKALEVVPIFSATFGQAIKQAYIFIACIITLSTDFTSQEKQKKLWMITFHINKMAALQTILYLLFEYFKLSYSMEWFSSKLFF